ncbi:MAG: glycosyltransferase [Microthrixaceae bacterium]
MSAHGAEVVTARPTISIVIPTHQRREVVGCTLGAVGRVEAPWPIEVIVVDDGSTDGTAAALREAPMPFPLRVVSQPHSGASVARNHGASLASGEILLFLDDDMEPERGLLLAHVEAHRTADAVVGDIPLHPESPRTLISEGVAIWAQQRGDRLRAGGVLTAEDLLTGQLSVTRKVFDELGGFDPAFTRDGAFGGEDTDFLHRLAAGGRILAFAPGAVSRQRYVVTPRQYLRQWNQAGAATATILQKHPRLEREIFEQRRARRHVTRRLIRPLARRPRLNTPIRALLRPVAAAIATRGRPGGAAAALFFRVRDLEWWSGLESASRALADTGVRVLAYHAITDVDDPVLKEWMVSPRTLDAQLTALQRAGCTFVDGSTFLEILAGRTTAPKRAILLTFDDAYADLVPTVEEILRRHHAPAVVFAVSALVGATNQWDQHLGASILPLLDCNGLRRLTDGDVEIGSHSRTHRDLTTLPDTALAEEVAGSVEELAALGLPRPRMLAYPYGECDDRVVASVAASGLDAAFALADRVAAPGSNRFEVPRFEVRVHDSGPSLVRRLFAPT